TTWPSREQGTYLRGKPRFRSLVPQVLVPGDSGASPFCHSAPGWNQSSASSAMPDPGIQVAGVYCMRCLSRLLSAAFVGLIALGPGTTVSWATTIEDLIRLKSGKVPV